MGTVKALSKRLLALDACSESRQWAETRTGRRSYKLAWETCPRGDWLLWLAGKLEIDRRLIVLAACDCAETALIHVPAGEARPRLAIETARRWAGGLATIDEVGAAAAAAAYADAAYAAYAAAYVADAAAYVADAAAYAATYAAAAAAAYAAADAADAAAAYVADRRKSLAKSADLVRARIPWPVMRDALRRVQ